MATISAESFESVRYVFLDRDGVVNRKPAEDQTIFRWSDFDVLPGVEASIRLLNECGYKAIIVTNQRGIALGRYTAEDLTQLHQHLQEHLASFGAHLDAIYYCPHDRNQCDCRKPEAGMIHAAFRDFPEATVHNSVIIGDSISDIELGVRLGMKTIFVQGDPRFQKPGAERAAANATLVVTSLHQAVFDVLAGSRSCTGENISGSIR